MNNILLCFYILWCNDNNNNNNNIIIIIIVNIYKSNKGFYQSFFCY